LAQLRATAERLAAQLAAQQAELVERQVNFNATCERLGEQLEAKNEELAAHQTALSEMGTRLQQARQLTEVGGRELATELRRRALRRVFSFSRLGRPSQAR